MSEITEETPSPRRLHAPEDRLESWKEIAVYLKRGVRTVQRWERGEGLPIYRHEQQKRATPYAFKGELDAWRNKHQEKLGRQSAGDIGRQLKLSA